jgi:hypothetical protein
MTSMEEFAFIAAQLEWLEGHLRAQTPVAEPARMESALNALMCAQAVISELAHLGEAGQQTVETSVA